MGFHICQFCAASKDLDAEMAFSPYSSVDVTLVFTSGRSWVFPHVGLLHYVTRHGYAPPPEFVEDVMHSELQLAEAEWWQTKSIPNVQYIGYLTDDHYQRGIVVDNFVERLTQLIERVRLQGGSSSSKYAATRSG